MANLQQSIHAEFAIQIAIQSNIMTSMYMYTLLNWFVTDGSLGVSNCVYESYGLLTLAPHGRDKLGLILHASDVRLLRDVVSLAAPTIPPMTRSPVSTTAAKIYYVGSMRCTGFHWEFCMLVCLCVLFTSLIKVLCFSFLIWCRIFWYLARTSALRGPEATCVLDISPTTGRFSLT